MIRVINEDRPDDPGGGSRRVDVRRGGAEIDKMAALYSHFFAQTFVSAKRECGVAPTRGGGRPGVRGAAGRPRQFQRRQVADDAGSAGGPRAPDCGPGTGRADTWRRRCPAPHRRCRRPRDCPHPRSPGPAAAHPAAEYRSAAVIFEAGQPFGQARQQRLRHHLADRPLRLRRRGDSSSPTPSTRSPADVSYQCPST